ncbi:hypothetical protein [Exiguobacterium sp. s48]|uniref:hypothetical protein n=1 Tax=Exiguobacterium sp. s48 TaxID=2751273 RepID=UPI001BEBDF63|nr:hypothetical protein [Exiguobacterium sp. s48]
MDYPPNTQNSPAIIEPTYPKPENQNPLLRTLYFIVAVLDKRKLKKEIVQKEAHSYRNQLDAEIERDRGGKQKAVLGAKKV